MFNLALFAGSKLDVSTVGPDEPLVSLALFGGAELDFTAVRDEPPLDVTVISIFGGTDVRVRPEQEVRVTGFSLFGGRQVEPLRRLTGASSRDDDPPEPIEIAAYSVFGGMHLKRAAPIE
jgi:hypothetical protein